MSQQPSGWYDDPSNPEMLRYWDGVMWTNHTAPRKSPTLSQPTAAIPQAPPVPPQEPQKTTPMPQGGGWQGQNLPQQTQYPGQYPQYPQAPGWLAAGPSTVDGVPLAAWIRRVGARLIDNIITGIVASAVGWPWLRDLIDWYTNIINTAVQTGVTPDASTISAEVTKYALPFAMVGLVVGVIYETFFLVRSSATPGKMALGISVRRTGAPGTLDIVSAVKRQLIQVVASVTNTLPAIGSLFGFLSLLDYLWPLWDSKRQALHDKLADTQVVVGKQPRRQA